MDINDVTRRIIRCAIEVHRNLGPCLLEPSYDKAMCIEFDDAKIEYQHQVRLPARYKGRPIGDYRLDFIVENAVVVELKSVDRLHPVMDAQMLTYLRVAEKRVGLLINFNSRLVTEGIKRFVL